MKPHLLTTARLTNELIGKAKEHGMEIDVLPFVETVPVMDAGLEEEIIELRALPLIAVFTSAKAVNAVAAMANLAETEWDIYCIGGATKDAVQQHIGPEHIRGAANDAAALARVIIADNVLEVVFFCGDKRMDTLPNALEMEDIIVYELVVYNTAATPHKITEDYDGILFFSPSAVHSFFGTNSIHTGTILFAVGTTTADAVKEYTGNVVAVSKSPSKEEVLMLAIEYFNHHPAPVTGNGQ